MSLDVIPAVVGVPISCRNRGSGSTDVFGRRSRTWPCSRPERWRLPRYVLIVLALAGDSTTTTGWTSFPSGVRSARARCGRQVGNVNHPAVGRPGRSARLAPIRSRRAPDQWLRETSPPAWRSMTPSVPASRSRLGDVAAGRAGRDRGSVDPRPAARGPAGRGSADAGRSPSAGIALPFPGTSDLRNGPRGCGAFGAGGRSAPFERLSVGPVAGRSLGRRRRDVARGVAHGDGVDQFENVLRPRTRLAPSRISMLQPEARASNGWPGTARTSRPRSSASRAVIRLPDRAAASTTTTPRDRARRSRDCGVESGAPAGERPSADPTDAAPFRRFPVRAAFSAG